MRGRQGSDRRQNTKGIGGQEDDIGGVTGHAGDLRVLDELDRVGAAGVLGDADVRIVNAAVLLEDDVLEDSAKTQGPENIRFVCRSEINCLGVATAFDIENAVV